MTLGGRSDGRTDPQCRFEEAVRCGESETVRQILAEGGVNPSARDNAALEIAVRNEDKRTLEALSTTVWDPAYADTAVDPRALDASVVPPEMLWHVRRLEAIARCERWRA